MRTTSVWRHFDVWLTAAVLLLTFYGIMMIRSAVTGAPAQAPLPGRQVLWLGISVVSMLIMAGIDYRLIMAGHWYVYFGVIASLILVYTVGTINNSARRWFDLGVFQLQPSEFGRIVFVITFAQFLSSRQRDMTSFRNTILSLLYVGVPVGLIFIQPDLGMSILYMVMWFVMIWMAGLPLLHFLLLGSGGLVGAVMVIPRLQEYQQGRLLAFLRPEDFPEEAFNVDQAVIAIGSGGWFGKGYFRGTQSQLGFLRVQHTDFIFSVIGEEMGFFFGAVVVLGLMMFILWRILGAAALTPDPVGKLACAGIAGVLFFQTLVSVGMNLRILPVTGLTLPFVSYGGSSLITWYLTIGVVQSIRMRHRKQEFG
jgi:rod shape determining protein RodA